MKTTITPTIVLTTTRSEGFNSMMADIDAMLEAEEAEERRLDEVMAKIVEDVRDIFAKHGIETYVTGDTGRRLHVGDDHLGEFGYYWTMLNQECLERAIRSQCEAVTKDFRPECIEPWTETMVSGLMEVYEYMSQFPQYYFEAHDYFTFDLTS